MGYAHDSLANNGKVCPQTITICQSLQFMNPGPANASQIQPICQLISHSSGNRWAMRMIPWPTTEKFAHKQSQYVNIQLRD
jgi:hypothetical protein